MTLDYLRINIKQLKNIVFSQGYPTPLLTLSLYVFLEKNFAGLNLMFSTD